MTAEPTTEAVLRALGPYEEGDWVWYSIHPPRTEPGEPGCYMGKIKVVGKGLRINRFFKSNRGFGSTWHPYRPDLIVRRLTKEEIPIDEFGQGVPL